MTAWRPDSPQVASLPAAASLNRVIRIVSRPGVVRAALEDDFHHFLVEIAHADGVVTAARSESRRFPYSLCPAAGERLGELVGTSVRLPIIRAQAQVQARLQCTHQHDLAVLAMTAAGRGPGSRRYHAVVADGTAPGKPAVLDRDGAVALSWTLADYAVQGPAPYEGLSLGAGFAAWVGETLDEAAAEAALVLRRAVFISRARGTSALLDATPHAFAHGGCWVQQPDRAPSALRERGSAVDFAGRSGLLTADDDAWLAGGMEQ